MTACTHCHGTGMEPGSGALTYALYWTPLPGMSERDFARFLSKVEILSEDPDACWLWAGTFFTNGYGAFRWDGKNNRAHRLSLRMAKGESTLNALHSCDTPACVRPDHLRWGTIQENHDDARSRNRHARGDEHGKRKLSEGDVREIRAEYATGTITQRELAVKWGMSEQAINNIFCGRTWSHV